MGYEHKALALMMLVGWNNFAVKIREDKTWYVELAYLERKDKGMLVSHTSASETPVEAIEAAWEWATSPDYYLVVQALRNTRRAVKWNGFMWQDVPERL
jgi:hypothetical protein